MSSTFDVDLDSELQGVASERVNALQSVVSERYAALRLDLSRRQRRICDGVATEATPRAEAGDPVEVKAARVEHTHPDGYPRQGRFSVHVDSHADLVAEGGWYAIVVYREVEVDGDDRILVVGCGIVDADEVDRWVGSGAARYQKVRWSLLLDDDDAVATDGGGSA